MAQAPADTSTIISGRIRVGRFGSTGILSEYQNLQLSGPHGITTVTGPRRYIKNVSLLLLDHVIAWLVRLSQAELSSASAPLRLIASRLTSRSPNFIPIWIFKSWLCQQLLRVFYSLAMTLKPGPDLTNLKRRKIEKGSATRPSSSRHSLLSTIKVIIHH